MTNNQLDTPPGYLTGSELYELCSKLYEVSGSKDEELSLYGQRPPSRRPLVFNLWRHSDYCQVVVRGHAPGNDKGATTWYAHPDFATRNVMSARGRTERLGVPPWLLDSLTTSLRTPKPFQCYRLDKSPFIVGTLADGRLEVMHGTTSKQEAPPELRELDLSRFWELLNAGRLTPTAENLTTAGWLWQQGEPDDDGDRKLVRATNAAGRFQGPGLREPLDLPQAFPMSCYTNVIANIRWMFGTSDLQGPEAVAEVDRLSHRGKDKGAYIQPQLHLLLREGYRLISFGDWDRDRLRREGVQYLREHSSSWTSEDAEYWTDERVAQLIRRDQVFHGRDKRDFPPYSSQILEVGLRPRMRDLERLLQYGYVVSVFVKNGSPGTSHGILVFGCDSKGFAVYDPDEDGRTLRYYSRRELSENWLPEDGLEAIKR